MHKLLLALASLLWLSACSSISVNDYADSSPELVLQDFFDGQSSAHGIIKSREGRVIRSFNATIESSWENGVGTLDEHFTFDDGETQRRVWTLKPDGNGGYIGTAGDVIGEGQLQVAGNALFLDYVLRIPYGDGTVDVRVDDRMYLVSPDVLINESKMIKFGFEVGSITLAIIRHP